MCGICGIINFNNESVQESPVRNMMQIMKHRGPDDEGVFLEDNFGLGFVRLSIIDLSQAGHQPFFSHDDRYVIVYNGEIYNYIELRDELKSLGHLFKTNSDTEVLLASYIEWGEECMNRFNGMWAFAIYDRIRKALFAARDRYGIKPFYYYYNNDIFAFASEIPPLLSLIKQKPNPDYKKIFDYLVFNRTDQTERTFFSEIKKLQHGNKLKINDDEFANNRITNHESQITNHKFQIKKWYDLRDRVSNATGFKNPGEFRQLLSSSIGLRLRSDVPVGVCLSGGLDSSSIVSLLLKDYKRNNIETFSAVYERGQNGDESDFINEFKPLLTNMYFTRPSANSLYNDIGKFIRAHAEPVPETGVYAQFKVMELASTSVVVTLDGQGADEELAGYHYFFGYFFKDILKQLRFGKLSSEIYHYLVKHQSIYGLKTFLYFLLPEKSKTRLRVDEKGYLNPEFEKAYKDTNSVAGNLYNSDSLNNALIDHFEYKLEHLLKWEDRNSMCFSLEARVPFLDYRLVEKALATSGEMIIKKGNTKNILRESMEGILPEKIRRRQDKIGFGTPQDEWFRTTEWDKTINELFSDNLLSSRCIIDTEIAKRFFLEHQFNKKNLSKEIWKWINLEIWFENFIDR